MSKKESLKKKQGVPKGVDPAKHERCVRQVKRKDVKNPYAVCNASLQKSWKEEIDKISKRTLNKALNKESNMTTKSKEDVKKELVKSLTEKFEGKEITKEVKEELKKELEKALKAGYDAPEQAPEDTHEVDPGAPLQESTEEKAQDETTVETKSEENEEEDQEAQSEPNFGGLFKPYSLGPSLKQTPAGNVVDGIKQPAMDYDKVAKDSVRNETYTLNDKGELVKKEN